MGKELLAELKCAIFKNSWKSGKCLKSKAILSILGEVALIKVVSEFGFGHLKCQFCAHKNGHFCQMSSPNIPAPMVNGQKPNLEVGQNIARIANAVQCHS